MARFPLFLIQYVSCIPCLLFLTGHQTLVSRLVIQAKCSWVEEKSKNWKLERTLVREDKGKLVPLLLYFYQKHSKFMCMLFPRESCPEDGIPLLLLQKEYFTSHLKNRIEWFGSERKHRKRFSIQSLSSQKNWTESHISRKDCKYSWDTSW